MRLAKTLGVLLCIGAPSTATADGGAPLLLLGGPVVFVLGQFWIVLSEALVLRGMVRALRFSHALRDVVAANVRSLLVVGLLVPVCVSAAGWVVAVVLGLGFHVAGLERAGAVASTWSFVLTGWVFNSEWVRRVFPYQFLAWFVVSFLLSVRVEARVLDQRWASRGCATGISATRTAWVVNAVSYAGLACVLGVMAVRYKTW